MIFFYTFLIIGTVLSIWGSQTRGSWSSKISMFGGVIWFLTLIAIFSNFGIKIGFIAIFVSFVVGVVCQKLFPKKV